MYSASIARSSALFIAAALLLISGCSNRWQEDTVDGLRRLTTTVSVKNNGAGSVDVSVNPGEVAMLATLQTEAGRQGHFRRVTNEAGIDVYDALAEIDGIHSKTNGGFLGDVVTLNWPVGAFDPPLGVEEYTLEIGLADDNAKYVSGQVSLEVLIKKDADLGGGRLDVAIIFAGTAGDDPAVVAATEDAIELWVGLYATLGITVSFHYYDYPKGVLDAPGFGSEADYEAISDQTPVRELNLVIVDEILDMASVYGIAGDIPGPLVSSARSAVVISALESAGSDGQFNDEETRLLAETMAHESGHLLGIFHPVEATWEAWDVLDDTPECAVEQDCYDTLGSNLMFPFPVCNPLGTCMPQSVLTTDQAGVANRYVGVR